MVVQLHVVAIVVQLLLRVDPNMVFGLLHLNTIVAIGTALGGFNATLGTVRKLAVVPIVVVDEGNLKQSVSLLANASFKQ